MWACACSNQLFCYLLSRRSVDDGPCSVPPPLPLRSPHASAEEGRDRDEDLSLRRMPTPSLSMQASDGEPMSGNHRTASVSSRGLLRWDTDRAKRIISREKDAIHSW